MSSSEEDNKVYARKSKVSEQITPSQSTAEGQTRRTTKRRYSNSVERPDSKRAKMNESENRIASKVQEHLKDSIKEKNGEKPMKKRVPNRNTALVFTHISQI